MRFIRRSLASLAPPHSVCLAPKCGFQPGRNLPLETRRPCRSACASVCGKISEKIFLAWLPWEARQICKVFHVEHLLLRLCTYNVICKSDVNNRLTGS